MDDSKQSPFFESGIRPQRGSARDSRPAGQIGNRGSGGPLGLFVAVQQQPDRNLIPPQRRQGEIEKRVQNGEPTAFPLWSIPPPVRRILRVANQGGGLSGNGSVGGSTSQPASNGAVIPVVMPRFPRRRIPRRASLFPRQFEA